MAYQADDSALVKKPHVKTPFTDKQLTEFAKTADRKNGAYFFMDNFFWIQHPVRGRIQYKAFPYQRQLLQVYHENRFSINMLSRQTGKCEIYKTMINKNNKNIFIGDLLWKNLSIRQKVVTVLENWLIKLAK